MAHTNTIVKLDQRLLTGLTATGTNQATAFPLWPGNVQHEFTTVASGTGAILPTAIPAEISIHNAGANTLSVYPPVGGSIDGGSTNAAVTIATGITSTFLVAEPGTWYTHSTSAGGGGSGTVTSVATGTGLTGGPISTTGTIAMATSTIDSLAGFSHTGVFGSVTVSTGLSLSSGVLTATGGGSTPLTPTAPQSSTYTAATGDEVVCNTLGGGGNVTITLPTAPAAGSLVGFKSIGTSFAVTVNAGGSDKFNSASGGTSLAYSLGGESGLFVYGGGFWYTVSESRTIGSLDTRYFNVGNANAGTLAAARGGTGISNTGTITLGGNLTTSGAFTTTLTVTANTNVTLPTSGTLATTAVATLSSLVSIGTITTGTWNATVITPTYGGTGLATLTAHAVLIGEGTGNVAFATVGTSGRPLIDQGGSADPAFLSTGVKIDSHFGVITTDTVAAGAVTCNLATSDKHNITLVNGTPTTISLSNATTGQVFRIKLIQDGTGSATVVWFTTIKWAGGSAPTLTTTASQYDVFVFECTGSNTYDGNIVGQNYS